MATLTISGQVLLSLGQDASATQILTANLDTFMAYAESEMEMEAGSGVGLVANYASITASYKQWLAVVCANRAAWHGVNQNQNSWNLATSQSKLNVLDTTWQNFIKKITNKDVIDDMGL